MPAGGVRTSLAGMISAMAASFRRQATKPPAAAASMRGQQTGPRADPSGGRGAPIYSYSFGANQGFALGNTRDITQFAPVQPSGGLFAPGYPTVPVEPERLRRLDFPVGYNYIWTPRSFQPIGFAELRGLAHYDIIPPSPRPQSHCRSCFRWRSARRCSCRPSAKSPNATPI